MPTPGAPPLGYGADLEGVQRVASCRSHKQGSDDRSLQERHRGPTRSPRSDEWPLFACAVRRRRFPVGESPTRGTLQPEATGAVMEVTKWLKPFVSTPHRRMHRVTDPACWFTEPRNSIGCGFEILHLSTAACTVDV